MRLTIAYVCMRTPCCRVLVTRGRSRLCQGPLAYILIDKAMEVACPTSPDARGRLSSSDTKLFRAFVEYSGLKIVTFRNEDFQDRQCLYRLPYGSQGIPLLWLLLLLYLDRYLGKILQPLFPDIIWYFVTFIHLSCMYEIVSKNLDIFLWTCWKEEIERFVSFKELH